MSTLHIFGIHSVAAIVKTDPDRLIEVYALKGRQDNRLSDIINEIRRHGVPVQFMHRKGLDDRSGGGSHQGIIAKVKPGKPYSEDDLFDIIDSAEMPFLLILDGVTDPHNLGACIRSADAAGVHAVIVPKDKATGMNPTTRKTASGAAEFMPLIQVTNLARTINQLKEKHIWVIGTAGEAEQNVFDAKLKGPLALVMGAEGKGLRRLTRESCDGLVKLPMEGSVSSLNVSVATGICLYEALRQRKL